MTGSQATQVRIHVTVSGTVQGVGFRYFAMQTARDLGLRGWVKNLGTGVVEAEAEGPGDKVDAFVETLRRGPSSAVVRDVRVQRVPPLGDTSFTIR